METTNVGHGQGHGVGAVNSTGYQIPPIVPGSSYFTHPEYSNLIMAHIVLMAISWFFILPISVMLSITRSSLSILAQMVFVAINAIGLLFGVIYNSKTPELYDNNAHHKIGWIATILVCTQVVTSLIRAYGRQAEGRRSLTPLVSKYQHKEDAHTAEQYRYSRDSGQGTEPSSPRTSSPTSCSPPLEHDHDAEFERFGSHAEAEGAEDEKNGLLGNNVVDRFLNRQVKNVVSPRVMRITGAIHNVLDRTTMILGFVLFTTGFVTYGGHFKGTMIFSGLAHFIKGGIFFWYGLLTLGRVMGSFSDLGWAWNVKPPASIVGSRRAAAPSAEFVESFLIFFYGSTNVFLEHLGSWGGDWSAGDLEHVSISVMFFGGGLCGMLVESRRIREFLNSTLSSVHGFGQSLDSWHPPKTYNFSTNPLPGIILLLLGLMMSSHHQESPVSTMLHKQWGTLFIGAALARAVTYILTYISPPTSFLPSRPPSELVVAFCLISGGLLFMGSNSDMVTGMEMYELNAMFLFTVMMGLTAFLMAWEIFVLAVKGWAVQREQRKAYAHAA